MSSIVLKEAKTIHGHLEAHHLQQLCSLTLL